MCFELKKHRFAHFENEKEVYEVHRRQAVQVDTAPSVADKRAAKQVRDYRE